MAWHSGILVALPVRVHGAASCSVRLWTLALGILVHGKALGSANGVDHFAFVWLYTAVLVHMDTVLVYDIIDHSREYP